MIYHLTVWENFTIFTFRNVGTHNLCNKIKACSTNYKKKTQLKISNVENSCQITLLHLMIRAYNIFHNKPLENTRND